jgi:glycosyltransferase involved in cell wall biosynthesis
MFAQRFGALYFSPNQPPLRATMKPTAATIDANHGVPAPAGGQPSIWMVIAAYNEGARLRQTLARVCALGFNVVVVDDGSRDNTREVALEHDVWVLQHSINRGQGAALQTGIDFALKQGADILVTFDADGQHCTDEVAALIEPVRSGRADVALGSRFLGRTIGLRFSRWLVLKLGVLFTRVVSGIRVSDTHNGFRALSRRAAERIRISQDRMAHASEILDRIRQENLTFCEVPVTIRYTAETMRKGQSSWNALKIASQLLLGRLIP